jgi:hypothetical protein
MTHLVLKNNQGSIIAVPVTAPSIIEEIAHKFGSKVIRTKTDGRSLMHTAALGEKKIVFAGNSDGAFIFPKFQTAFDAMFAFAKIMELLAMEKSKISDILKEIPVFHIAKSSVECTWQQKGKIMRRMIEIHKDKPMEVIEGLKIFYDQAWVLMIPDPALPYFHLFAEAQSEEQAEKILKEYENQILKIKDENSKGEDNRMSMKDLSEISQEDLASQGDVHQIYLPHEKSFHFWIPGRYLGIRARSFKEFVDAIHYIEPGSLEFHMSKGDFANWLEYELNIPRLAEKIRGLKESSLAGENLRQELIKVLE